MRLSEVTSWKRSQRVTIRPGDVVRFCGGGPEYKSEDGAKHRLKLPGRYKVRAIYQSGSRYWLEVSGLDRIAGCYVVFVGGKPYRRACLVHKPYKVKTKRKAKPCQPTLFPRS